MKYNGSGTKLWSRHMGCDDGDYTGGIAVNPNGNIIALVGDTWCDFEGNVNLGAADYFIMYNICGVDCDDNDASINPEATEE